MSCLHLRGTIPADYIVQRYSTLGSTGMVSTLERGWEIISPKVKGRRDGFCYNKRMFVTGRRPGGLWFPPATQSTVSSFYAWSMHHDPEPHDSPPEPVVRGTGEP